MPAKEPTLVSKWHNAAKFRQRGIFRPAAENPLIDLLLALPKCEAPARRSKSPKKPTSQSKTPNGRKSLRAHKAGASDTETPAVDHGGSITKVSSQRRAVVPSSPLRTKTTVTIKSRRSMLTEDDRGKPAESPTKGRSAATGKKRVMPESSDDEGQSTKPKATTKTAARKKNPTASRRATSETEADDSDNMPLRLPTAKRQRLSPIAESPAPSVAEKDALPKPVVKARKRKAAESEAEPEVTSPAKKARTDPTKVPVSPSAAPPPPTKTSVKSTKLATAAAGTSAAGGSKAAPVLKRWAMFESEGDDVQETKKEKPAGLVGPSQKKSMTSVKGKERAVEDVEAMPKGPDGQADDAVDDLPTKEVTKKARKKAAATKPSVAPKKRANTAVNEDDPEDVKGDEVKPDPKLKLKPKTVNSQTSAAASKGKRSALVQHEVQEGDAPQDDLEGARADEPADPPRKQPAKKVLKKVATARKKKADSEPVALDDDVVEAVDGEPTPKPKRGRGRPATKAGKKAPAKPRPKAKETVEDGESAQESEQEKPKPVRKKAAPKKQKKADVAGGDDEIDDDQNFTDTTVALNSAPVLSKKKPPSSRGGAPKPKPRSRPPPPRKSMFARALEAELNPDSEADPLDLFL